MDLKNSAKETFQLYLSKRGLKATLQRNLILNAFLQVGRHVRVDEFCQLLRAEHRHIGHATVYRTLKLFVESGIARELQFGDGFTRYEQVTEGRRHDHLVCKVCDDITEFDTGAIEQLKEEIARSHGFHVETLKLELRGVCRKCQALSRADLVAPGALKE